MSESERITTKNKILFFDILLITVIAVGLYFRLTGLFWGEYQYLHPDERFLVWVSTDIQPVESLRDYFNTHQSTLNPHNRGHGFYVYGNFPIIFSRYIAELALGHSGWNEMTQVGRSLSTIFDMGSVVLIFLIGQRLFNRRIGIFAAAFSAMAVLQIQQSHFFTVDTFATFFSIFALWIGVRIATTAVDGKLSLEVQDVVDGDNEFNNEGDRDFVHRLFGKIRNIAAIKTLGWSLLFGITVGLAAASKINTVTVAVLLPFALLILWQKYPHLSREQRFQLIMRDLIAGGFFALLSFRIFQPYAFDGPGFFGISLNEKWIANIAEVGRLSGGDVDYPPAMQWARRGFLFGAKNMTLWGLGLPLGIVAWAGFFTMAWRLIRGEWKKYLLVWVWAAVYFAWQSSLGNPTMRYFLPVYPVFALIAAWFIDTLWQNKIRSNQLARILRGAGIFLGIFAIAGTALWAFMFTRIYVDPITRIEASRWIYANVPGPINLMIEAEGNISQKILSYPYDYSLAPGKPYSTNFSVDNTGTLRSIDFANIMQTDFSVSAPVRLTASIYDMQDGGEKLATGFVENNFSAGGSATGFPYSIDVEPDIDLKKEHVYQVLIEMDGMGSLSINGSAVANETSWDDGLPMRVEGYDAYGGIYQRDINFEMYFDDNEEKLNRFLSNLFKSDYVFISSNRQWGTLTRLPERYPLTTKYYRSLLGCPEDKDIYWCYSVAKPGQFSGSLGFELVQTFESYPHIGSFEINDQFAEEAFTVYDHPKVLIFKKSESYDPDKVSQILRGVDLNRIVRLTPIKFPNHPADLMLPEERLIQQREGGTWSDLFNTSSVINQNQFLAVFYWYVVVLLLGWIIYPIIRIALHGLSDKGYTVSKLFGLLLLALIVWWAGSSGIPVTRTMITICGVVIAAISGVAVFFQRKELSRDIRENFRYFLLVEGLFLVLFAFFLLVRIGNPDLWHPEKGGEKPMDFSYLNAVIKSTSFPPFDPWYAGGYINYYYYGFVIVGVLIKWLGIVPNIAYNLVLPTLFGMVGLGAFGIGFNLIQFYHKEKGIGSPDEPGFRAQFEQPAVWAGLGAVLLVLILGNLGTVRMIWHNLQKLGSPDGMIESANIFQRWSWTFQGIADFFQGERFPLYPGDWYWVPSRVLPNEPITEFPYFTFIYADLHAHLIALPITLLVIGWAVSVLGSRWKGSNTVGSLLRNILTIAFGAVAIGALRPTNTWDFPTYLIFAAAVLLFTISRYGGGVSLRFNLPAWCERLFEALLYILVLVAASLFFYKPFSDWFGQAYTAVDIWQGGHSPFWSYLTHWGLFLFLIISWFVFESIDWMAKTPLSSIRKLAPFKMLIYIVVVGLVASVFLLLVRGVKIGWFTLPLAAWSLLLILRKGQHDSKRIILFMIGTALVLTLAVEVIVLRGDIGRMNTVFKFYFQAWVLFGISAASAFVWLLPLLLRHLSYTYRNLWQIVLIILTASAALYPLSATMEKVDHRMSPTAPRTLDGTAFIETAHYFDAGQDMALQQDYLAIQWMQENIKGSPVIVEANTVEYRWGNRYTIYTGLPGVVGWNWHQRQQRAALPSEWVTDRVEDITLFYTTVDRDEAQEFLEKYNVKFIILGQYERGLYAGPGLDKFENLDSELWREVYRNNQTVIYEVVL